MQTREKVETELVKLEELAFTGENAAKELEVELVELGPPTTPRRGIERKKHRGRKNGTKLHPLARPSVREALFLLLSGTCKLETLPERLKGALDVAQKSGAVVKQDDTNVVWITFEDPAALKAFMRWIPRKPNPKKRGRKPKRKTQE